MGFAALLVTGRVLGDLHAADVAPFDAVVAENGAIVWLPEQQRTIRLRAPPSRRSWRRSHGNQLVHVDGSPANHVPPR